MRKTSMHRARLPAGESATGFLRCSELLVLEPFPLNLLGRRRPECINFADQIAGFCGHAEVDQTKLNQVVVLNGGVGCA